MAVMLKTSIGNEIKLNIPSIETQKKILHLNQLWEREQALTQALLMNRKQCFKACFNNYLMRINNDEYPNQPKRNKQSSMERL